MKATFRDFFRVPLGFHINVANANLTDNACAIFKITLFQRPECLVFLSTWCQTKTCFGLKRPWTSIASKTFSERSQLKSPYFISFQNADSFLTGAGLLTTICISLQAENKMFFSKCLSLYASFTRNGYIDLTCISASSMVRPSSLCV